MTEKVGIGVISFNSPDEAKACVESILLHTTPPYDLVVWDNSFDWRTGELLHKREALTYIRSPYNVGCCCSRNRLWERWLSLGVSRAVVIDQDVAVLAPGWVDDMLAVFQKYPDTGCVSWRCISDQLCNNQVPDETGAVPQVAGACCMWSGAAVRAIGGWHPGTLFFRLEDSDACFRAGLKGYRTRLVCGGVQKIAHPTFSSGMGRHPRCEQVKAYSEAVFRQRAAAFGYPPID